MWTTQYNSETKIWSGSPFPPLFDSRLSLGQLLLWLLERNPTKIAQISDNNNKYVSNAELRLKTIRAALRLEALGFQKNDVLTVVSKNNHDLAPVVFAALCLGCPINAAGISFDKSEMMHMFRIAKPKAVFCEVEVYDVVKESLRDLNNDAQIFTFGSTIKDSINVDKIFKESTRERYYQAPNFDAENTTAIIVCSSGTTGLPKGVCLSHAILANVSNRMLHLNEQDIFFSFSSLHWVSGIFILISCTVQGATRVITTAPYTPETFLQIVEKRKVTGVLTASYHVNFLLKSTGLRTTDLSKLTKFYCAGSKISSEIVDEMNKFLPNGKVFVSYGSSEIGAFASTNYPSPNNRSVGKVLGGIKMKIIDDDGQKIGIGESGEICILPMNKALGYYGNKMATDEIFDSEGFIKTGDVGFFDNDGYLVLIDRKKDIFKYYSTHISPSEFEEILANHPAIKAVCVVDVPDPEEMAPDLPTAVIVKSGIGDISEDEVHEIISENLPKEKRLVGGVYFTDQLPMTGSDKIKRMEVRKIAKLFFDASHQKTL